MKNDLPGSQPGKDIPQRKELLEVFNNTQLFKHTIRIELWNVSKRPFIFDKFTQKMLNGNTYNDCPDEDIIVWRKLSTEDKERLSTLEEKNDREFYTADPFTAMRILNQNISITNIKARGFITKKECNYLDL